MDPQITQITRSGESPRTGQRGKKKKKEELFNRRYTQMDADEIKKEKKYLCESVKSAA